ncbi:hypothetical protein HA402_009105 [Bradysia odoriphaga]|nr:hypothetical protein HA402_009105 [Bradysia odoriphaga]
MSFMCNSCFAYMERGQMPGGPCILTSCFHILCNACSHRIRNNECTTCAKQCKIVTIGKDMPLALKAYFEPPLSKIEKIQQQFKFLKQQQEIAFKVKSAIEFNQKKKELRIKKIVDMEKQVKAEEQRLERVVKQKIEAYRHMKEKYQKLKNDEMRLRQALEKIGRPVDKDLSADSGISFEKSARFEN